MEGDRTARTMGDAEEDTFCKKMRKATREIHAVSDALVNARLAFGEELTSRPSLFAQ